VNKHSCYPASLAPLRPEHGVDAIEKRHVAVGSENSDDVSFRDAIRIVSSTLLLVHSIFIIHMLPTNSRSERRRPETHISGPRLVSHSRRQCRPLSLSSAANHESAHESRVELRVVSPETRGFFPLRMQRRERRLLRHRFVRATGLPFSCATGGRGDFSLLARTLRLDLQ
jgi:hypothetical protein